MRLLIPILLNCFFVFVVYLLISGLFLGFSAGGFIVNFKELGFSIISGVEKGIHSVTNGVSTFFTAIGDLADLRVEYEKLQAKLEDYEYLQRQSVSLTLQLTCNLVLSTDIATE